MTHFLKCDAPDCNHFELVEEITADHIGWLCPVCKSDLLTKEDYDLFMSVINSKEFKGTGVTHVHKGKVTSIALDVNQTNQPKGNK